MAIDDKKLLDTLTRVSKLISRVQGDEYDPSKGKGHGKSKGHGRSGGRGGHGQGGMEQDLFGYVPVVLGALEGRNGHGKGHGKGKGKGKDKGHDGEKNRETARAGQDRILSMLAVKDGLSQKYLAYLLGIRPQTLSEALVKLEGKGYVERKKDENDRRVTLVYLTDEGRERAEEINAKREKQAEDISSVLTEEEKEQLATILAKLDAGLEQQEEQEDEEEQEETDDDDDEAVSEDRPEDD